MYVIKSDKTLFCDCDDTLVVWAKDGHSFKPHKAHIELLKRFFRRGQPVIVWSAGGYQWALEVVKMLKLQKYVTAVMAKPCWYVDDQSAVEFMPEHNRIYIR